MLIRKQHRVADSYCLLQILRSVGLEQNHVAVDRRAGSIDIAEYLCLGGIEQLLAAIDVELGAQLFALVTVENSQRKTNTDAKIKIDRRITPDVEAESGIG